jgi:cysteine-rich repeat protein
VRRRLAALAALSCGCSLLTALSLPLQCGDGLLTPDADPPEACDDGNNVDGDGCEADCTLPACRNGILDPGELCLASAGPTPAGLAPAFGAADDLDGDGDTDLAVLDPDGDAAQVFLNDGAGRLSAGAVVAAGADARSLALGDLDGDALPELLIGATVIAAGELLAFENEGGEFPGAPRVALVGISPVGLAGGDLDGDGAADVAVVDPGVAGVGALFALLNDGGGGLAPLFPAVAAAPAAVTLGDVDGDGDIDAALASRGDDTVALFANNGAGQLLFLGSQRVGADPAAVTLGDLDGDGDLDAATADENGNTVSVCLNEGAGALATRRVLSAGSRPTALVTGDFNGDNALDLAVAEATNGLLLLFLNDGGGSFLQLTLAELPGLFGLVAADLNADGVTDLVGLSPGAGAVDVFLSEP